MFSWLNSRGKGDKEQSGKPKPNQDKNQSDFSILPKPQAKDNQQPNTSSQEETNTGVEIGNDQNRATSKSTQNRKSSNSNESPGGSSANLNSSADVTSIAPVRVEPIFIAPSLDLANTKQENVLGKNPDGSVIYISENPSADRASAQAGVGVSELPSSQTERIYSQQQEIAQTAVDSVVDRGKSVGATIKSTSPDSLTRIDSATKAATASIETEIEKQLSAIASLMNQSRSSISAASNKEIERIENHHANTISAIDARSETAVNQLEASAEKISQQMASSNATFSRRIDSVIEYNHAAISEKQQRARQTIDVIERTNIKKFRKQSPTKSDNPIVRALDNIGWNAYVTNWREAKIQVARGVAKASHQANTELFNNNFAKLAEYRTTTVNGGASLIASYQEALSNGHRQHKNAIRAKAGAALAQADQLKQQLITGVRQTESDLLGEVDNTEALYRQTLEQKKHSSTQELVTLGTKLGADVAGAISQGELRFNSAVASLSKGINTVGSFADLANAPAAAETAIAEIEFEKRKTQNEIERATANAEGQISEFANQIRSSLLAVTARAEAEQRQQQTRHNNQLLSSANSSTLFGRVLGGYNKSAEDEVTAATASWQQQSSNLIGQLSTAENNLSKQLNIAQDQIELQKQSQLRGIVKEIETQAPIEAAKVKPAWKKVVRIIVNVGISVATTVAIAALAMSGVGLVAAIGLFALIGAAGGVAKLAANDLIDGKTSSAKDYLKAGAIGALTGVIEGLGGRAVVGVGGKLGAQMLTKIEHMVASTGIEAVTNTLVELTEAMGQGQDFTLKLLGISILSSLLSTAGGKYIDVKFSDIARGAARGVGNGVADGATREATQQGGGLAAGQFATETAFDTGVETGASVARGEELTIESFGENLAGGVLGRGAAGRADKLRGNKLRGLGNNRDGDVNSQTGERRNDGVESNNANRTGGENNKGSSNTRDNTTRNNSDSDTPGGDRAPRQPIPTNQKRNREFERVASVGLSRRVTVYSDPDLEGNTVRAEYKLNSRGVVQDVHLRAGLGATANDIKLHQHTVKVMRMYGGTLGKVRLVEAKIAKWIGIHGQPQTGTRAWEAQHEVPKLNRVISDRLQTLETAEPEKALRLEAEIEDLIDQLIEHRRTFEIQNESDGVGYIAQRGVKRKAEEISNLRQKAPTELKTQLEQPPVGILTKQEIGQWLWRQENPSKDPNTMPKNLNARADTLIRQWLEQGLEIYLTSDSKIAFDKSLRDAYDAERSSKQPKTLQEKYISPYKDSMYSEAEKVTLAPGWEFQTGEIISTADRIAEGIIDNSKLNQTNPVKVNPTVFGEAASTIDDFAYDRTSDKPYEYGEGRRYEVGQTEDNTVLGYKHYRQKFNERTDVGRIGDLDSGRGIDYNRLPRELIKQLKTDGIEVEAGKEGVYVGQQLTKLMNGEKLPPGKTSQIITELYGLWFAKEPSHPWEFDNRTRKSEATFEHQRDLIYSKMITQLMESGEIKTLQEALELHPASYGGAQKGARRVTGEMNEEQSLPGEETKIRSFRDERYRREKETLQKWFEMYEEQLLKSGQQPNLENLKKFIEDNI